MEPFASKATPAGALESIWILCLGMLAGMWAYSAFLFLIEGARIKPVPPALVIVVYSLAAAMYIGAIVVFITMLRSLEQSASATAVSRMTLEQRTQTGARYIIFLMISMVLMASPSMPTCLLRARNEAYLGIFHGSLLVSLVGLLFIRLRGIPACLPYLERLSARQ